MEEYSFADVLKHRMSMTGVSDKELGEMCEVTEKTVRNWKNGNAYPDNRVCFIEIGMMLGLNETELNQFLVRNGFRPLEAGVMKDDVARLVLSESRDRKSIVSCYRMKYKILNDNFLEDLSILQDDLDYIQYGINIFQDDVEKSESMDPGWRQYRFCDDLVERMTARQITSAELHRRCNVSEETIRGWRNGTKMPRNRERFKEIGMALELDENELNEFLRLNGVPALHIRNLYDNVASLVLHDAAGKPDIVKLYNEQLKRYLSVNKENAEDTSEFEDETTAADMLTAREELLAERVNGDEVKESDSKEILQDEQAYTVILEKEWSSAVGDGHPTKWFRMYSNQYGTDKTRVMPSSRLSEFVQLFVDDKGINEMKVNRGLPDSLAKMLYCVVVQETVTVENLRDKLIAFGIYSNMTVPEINLMLGSMHCSPLLDFVESMDPSSNKLDIAIFYILNNVHIRYPYYEFDNNEAIRKRLIYIDTRFKSALMGFYMGRGPFVQKRIGIYDNKIGRLRENSEERKKEEAFWEYYTSYGDKGLMEYVYDMLTIMVYSGVINNDERTKNMLSLLKRAEVGEENDQTGENHSGKKRKKRKRSKKDGNNKDCQKGKSKSKNRGYSARRISNKVSYEPRRKGIKDETDR